MKRIAIIEDDQPIRELYRMKFESDGYHVSVAKDGSEGMTLVKEFDPHVVLLDIMMPYVSGYKIIEYLDAKTHTPHIIVLTNLFPDDVAKKVPKSVNDIFMKVETTPEVVAERVAQLLSD